MSNSKSSKLTTRALLLLLVIAKAFSSLSHTSTATTTATTSVRVSITTGERMDEDAPAWVTTPPTADHATLLARALSDASNYLATVQRPICLLSVFMLKVQQMADARYTNYLFQVNGCVVETPSPSGFCRDTSCRAVPFEVEVHTEQASSGQDGSKLVVAAIRYLD